MPSTEFKAMNYISLTIHLLTNGFSPGCAAQLWEQGCRDGLQVAKVNLGPGILTEGIILKEGARDISWYCSSVQVWCWILKTQSLNLILSPLSK